MRRTSSSAAGVAGRVDKGVGMSVAVDRGVPETGPSVGMTTGAVQPRATTVNINSVSRTMRGD